MSNKIRVSQSGSGAPTEVTPNFKGQVYVNETDGSLYRATGTSSGNWEVIPDLNSSQAFTNKTYSGVSVSVGSGSATTPSVSFTTDVDSGMYLSADGVLGFATVGVKRLEVQNNGLTAVGGVYSGTESNFVGYRAENTTGGGDTVLYLKNSTKNAYFRLKNNYSGDWIKIDNGTDWYMKIGSTGINIPTGSTFQINGVNLLDTDNTMAGNSDIRTASQKAVKYYIDNLISSANALVYKGVVDCSSNPNYPAADAGHLYVVSVAGKIGGASGVVVDTGDLCLCNTDGTSVGDQATVGTKWNIVEKNVEGAVSGPASAIDERIAVYNGITGKIIKDGGYKISDLALLGGCTFSGNITVPSLITTGSIELGNASDTTISRVSAGRIAVEGVNVVTISSTDTLTNKTLTSPTLTTPTLGTPSSGTLTNCTGLPIAGLVASTSTALGVGSLELGHASDTTLSRGAAGFLAVEGKRVPSPASQAAGDMLYRGSTEWERLAKGTAGQVLKMNTGATAPEWGSVSGGPEYALDTGSANAYAIAPASAPTAYTSGMMYMWRAINACTGASTLNVNSLGALPIWKKSKTSLASGDIAINMLNLVGYEKLEDEVSYSGTDSDEKYEQNVGYNGTYLVSQSFTGAGGLITSAKFYLKKRGSPTGNLVYRLYASSSYAPTGSVLATSGTLDVSTTTSSFAEYELTFETPYITNKGTAYCLVVYYLGGDTTNYLRCAAATTNPQYVKISSSSGSSWSDPGTPCGIKGSIYEDVEFFQLLSPVAN